MQGETGVPRWQSAQHKGVSTGIAAAASLLIFLALLPLLKRSAVRAAMRQGAFDVGAQTAATADGTKPPGQPVTSKPAVAPEPQAAADEPAESTAKLLLDETDRSTG